MFVNYIHHILWYLHFYIFKTMLNFNVILTIFCIHTKISAKHTRHLKSFQIPENVTKFRAFMQEIHILTIYSKFTNLTDY